MTSSSLVGVSRARPSVLSAFAFVALVHASACGRSSDAPAEPASTATEAPGTPSPPGPAAPAAPAEPPEANDEAPPSPTQDETPAKPVDEMSEPELEAACFQGRQEACDLLGE
jgi:outer membrane biosynthesis protein TonB